MGGEPLIVVCWWGNFNCNLGGAHLTVVYALLVGDQEHINVMMAHSSLQPKGVVYVTSL